MNNSEKPTVDLRPGMAQTVTLHIELPKQVVSRIEILSEAYEGDAARVVTDAIMGLWETRYSQVQGVSPENLAAPAVSASAQDEPAGLGSIMDRYQRVLTLHGEGVPVEDVAQEVDWPEETVNRIVELESSPPDRDVLRDRAQTLQALGMSVYGIARQWNELGVPTLSGKGRWHRSVVNKLLES